MSPGPRVVWMPGGLRTEVHLRGEDTGGAFCLLADEPQPGWSLPPHRPTRAEAPTDLQDALTSAERHGWEFIR